MTPPSRSVRLPMARVVLCLLVLGVPMARAGDVSVVGALARDAMVAPGDRVEGEVLIRNGGTEPQEVRAYLTDYTFYADGRNTYGEPGSLERSNGGWVTFVPQQLTVLPDKSASVTYAINVPDDASLHGTYWSMLMIEPMASSGGPEEASQPEVAVNATVRYGIQLSTSVGDATEQGMRFAGVQMVKQEDVVHIFVDVENDGTYLVRPTVWIEVFEDQGGSLGRFESTPRRIYPECSVRFDVDLSGLAAGRYAALIVVDNGDDYVVGSQHVLEIE